MLHLDHVIILIPYQTLLDPPPWITNSFTLSPGGRHADGKTENKLICFQDGSYIELISFINDDPQNREGHWWGEKSFGIIDFALTHRTSDADIQYSELKERLHRLSAEEREDASYAEPIAGGRERPDGKSVRWKVTFPLLRNRQRGELPFFCHDVTPRDLRVPMSKEHVSHPSGAYGIKELSIFLEERKFPDILKIYSAIFGVENKGQAPPGGTFNLNQLHEVDGTPVSFQVQVPVEDSVIQGMGTRSGVWLGNLVLACHGGDQSMYIPGNEF